MFDEIKKILAEEFSIDEEKITPEAEFVNDLAKVRSKLICIKITIKAAKATARPATFNAVAILNRLNTLRKFRIIVFILLL